MKVALIGSVSSSRQILLKLIEYKFNVQAVFGLEPDNPDNVSGLTDLSEICGNNNIEYYPFKKINDSNNIQKIEEISPDVIFAVGFSQLVSEEILSVPSLGCIGFHPTKLPEGRGRGTLAWLILKENKGAATFFLMGKGADDGPIFVQQEFDVLSDDNAQSVKNKILKSIGIALDKWLPELKKGIWNPVPQDESMATYYGKRNPLDGWINWEDSALNIDKLIRATSKPLPGAFTFYKDCKLVVWESAVEDRIKITGVKGRVLLVKEDRILIQTGNGLLWLKDFELQFPEGEVQNRPELKVGEKLGYNIEYEIYKLKNNIRK